MKFKVYMKGNRQIISFQTTLDDFVNGLKTSFKELFNKYFGCKKSKLVEVSEEFQVSVNNRISYVIPVCPRCGSKKIHKRGSDSRYKKGLLGDVFKFEEQSYGCKKCGKRFKVEGHGLIEKGNRYLNCVKDVCKELEYIGHQAYRKTSEIYENILRIPISHQSVYDWSILNTKEDIWNGKYNYSGYYIYDEQFVNIFGERFYRLLLFDGILNIPVFERIVKNRTRNNILEFLKDSTKNKKFISLTTDLLPSYHSIINELGVKHQLCRFHLYQMIYDNAFRYIKRAKIKENEVPTILENLKPLTEVFLANSKKEALKRLDHYLMNEHSIPREILTFIKKHIKKYFDKYMEHLNDPNIPITSNSAERYFGSTLRSDEKKLYKTINGLTSHLKYEMRRWTVKYGNI